MDDRLRVGSLFEWLAAALCLMGLVWLVSVPVQRLAGPQVEAALVGGPERLPPGVPAGATAVPVILLLDGRAIRLGDPETRIRTLLPDSVAEGPPLISAGEFGDRYTRAYLVDGSRIYIVTERAEAGGPLRVTGLYVR